MILDVISSLAGLIIPPAFNFIKSKFSKNQNVSSEQTLSDLALTKPEIMPAYIDSQAKLLLAQKDYFNRDVSGLPHQWVIDLRAIIRPLFVLVSIAVIVADIPFNIQIDPSLRQFMEITITSWFGSRISN